MKTKKVVVGAMAAAVFAMSLNALPISFAATETVQISVGSQTVKAGETFSVDVTLADIPSTGIQGCDFSIQYDSSLITVTTVTAGALTETGAASADPTSSLVPNFESYILNDEGYVNLVWTTVLEDSAYWLQGEGVFCTIEGTVADTVEPGSAIDLTVVPTNRGTGSEIVAGYTNGSEAVKYSVGTNDGQILIEQEPTTTEPVTTTTTTTTTEPVVTTTTTVTEPPVVTTTTVPGLTTEPVVGEVKYGDADCNGEVAIADVVAIMIHLTTPGGTLTAEGINNADVYQRGDNIGNMDALSVQKSIAQLISELPESYLVS